MNGSILKSLGIMIVFGMLIPGIVFLVADFGLQLQIFELWNIFEPKIMIPLIIFFGFIADAIGHFIDIVWLCCKLGNAKCLEFYKRLWRVGKKQQKHENLENLEYWYGYRCLYMNSSVALFLSFIIKIIKVCCSNNCIFKCSLFLKLTSILFLAIVSFILSCVMLEQLLRIMKLIKEKTICDKICYCLRSMWRMEYFNDSNG